MPNEKEYKNSYNAVMRTLKTLEERNDIKAIVKFMSEITVETAIDNGAEDDNDPKYNAMRDYLNDKVNKAAKNIDKENNEYLAFLKAFAKEASENSLDTAYVLNDRFEEIKGQIKNGEIADAEYFASTDKKTKKLATAVMNSKTGLRREIVGARGAGQLLGVLVTQYDGENNGALGKSVAEFLSERAENGKMLPSEVDFSARQNLEKKEGMTPEKVAELSNLMSAQAGMVKDGYILSFGLDGKLFEHTPEFRKTIEDLSDEELAEKRKTHAELAEEAKKNNAKNAKRLESEVEEIDLEAQRRAYEKADPNNVKAISEDQQKLWDVCAEHDKLTRFQMKVKTIVDITRAATDHLLEDMVERGKLNPKKHSEYLKLCDCSRKLSTLGDNIGDQDPRKIVELLSEVESAADIYYTSHYNPVYKSKAGTERNSSACIIKEAIGVSIDTLVDMAEELMPGFVKGQSINSRLEDLNEDKQVISESIISAKAQVKEKAEHAVAKEDRKSIDISGNSGVYEFDLDSAADPELPEEAVIEAPKKEEPEVKGRTADEYIAEAQDVVKFAMTQVKNKGQYPDKEALSKQYAQIVTAYYLKSQMKDKNDKIDTEVFSKQVDVVYHSNDFKETLRRNSAKTLYEQASADHAQDVYQNFVNVHAARKQEKTAANAPKAQPQAAKEIKAPNNNPVKK